MNPMNNKQKVQDEALLQIALKAALMAGKAILEIYQSDFAVDFKEDQSPLTAADLAAHKIIAEALKNTGIPLISEEGTLPVYDERRAWQRLWMIDPLDGTKEFISKNGEFTVNIALIENGKPILGVVYAPVPEVLYFGLGSLGAWKATDAQHVLCNCETPEQAISQSMQLPLNQIKPGFVAVCSRRHMNTATHDFIGHYHPETDDVVYISRGSSLKFCAVAEGSADLYPRFAPTMEWDSAAGQAIAEISGAHVLDPETMQPLVYNKPDLHNPSFIVVRGFYG